MKMTGAEMVVKNLEKNGVKVTFGYPGANICPLIDKLSCSGIRRILTRNEQGAAHMASGYAKVTGRAGVCIATSGPGATNLITGIATAYMDSVPLVALTGQVASPVVGTDAFQEVDITGATHPFTKHNYLVKDVREIGKIIDKAFFIAETGRPGPVVVDMPLDILNETYDFPDEDEPVNIRGYHRVAKPDELQVKKIATALKHAKRPVIMAGGGISASGADRELKEFVHMTGIPVVATMNGIGALDCSDENYLGMIGSHGIRKANNALNNSDLIVLAGARLSDRSIFYVRNVDPIPKIVHIDIDPAEIGKMTIPDISVVGDVKEVLIRLNQFLADYRVNKKWIEYINSVSPAQIGGADDDGFVNPRYFLSRLSEKTNGDVYITTEVGQNQIWTANYFKFREPRSLITSAGFGTMGYGLPAAIGAATVADKDVLAVMGDGSFQMDMAELGTLCQWDIPVKMIIFENNCLGMVREIQLNSYNKNYQMVHLDGSPDFKKIAEAYGIPSAEIHENSETDFGIDKLINAEGSFLLVVKTDPDEPTGERE